MILFPYRPEISYIIVEESEEESEAALVDVTSKLDEADKSRLGEVARQTAIEVCVEMEMVTCQNEARTAPRQGTSREGWSRGKQVSLLSIICNISSHLYTGGS